MTAARAVGGALAAGFAAAAIGSAAQAVEAWTPFFMIKQGVVYVDRNSVQQTGGKVSLATELWYETPPDLRGMMLNYVRSRVDVTCADRTFVIAEQRFFGMDGQLLGENRTPSAPASAARGTFESALMTAYCPKAP